jgi:hypothetical protein
VKSIAMIRARDNALENFCFIVINPFLNMNDEYEQNNLEPIPLLLCVYLLLV